MACYRDSFTFTLRLLATGHLSGDNYFRIVAGIVLHYYSLSFPVSPEREESGCELKGRLNKYNSGKQKRNSNKTLTFLRKGSN
jgi:hypothetical protein